jgi:hypothetical protein
MTSAPGGCIMGRPPRVTTTPRGKSLSSEGERDERSTIQGRPCVRGHGPPGGVGGPSPSRPGPHRPGLHPASGFAPGPDPGLPGRAGRRGRLRGPGVPGGGGLGSRYGLLDGDLPERDRAGDPARPGRRRRGQGGPGRPPDLQLRGQRRPEDRDPPFREQVQGGALHQQPGRPLHHLRPGNLHGQYPHRVLPARPAPAPAEARPAGKPPAAAIAGDEVDGDRQAALLSRITGLQVEYQRVPLELLETQHPDLAAMYDWLDRVGYSADIPGLRREFPEVGWHTFEAWAREQNWSAIL